MRNLDISQIDELVQLADATVVSTDGKKLGNVDQIWVDKVNGLPEWAQVKLGPVGMRPRMVPLRAADIRQNQIAIAYTKEAVESAPDFDPETSSSEEVSRLYRHYNQPLPAASPPEVRNPWAGTSGEWAPPLEQVLPKAEKK